MTKTVTMPLEEYQRDLAHAHKEGRLEFCKEAKRLLGQANVKLYYKLNVTEEGAEFARDIIEILDLPKQ